VFVSEIRYGILFPKDESILRLRETEEKDDDEDKMGKIR
jgi:hypothetical protein